MAALPIGAQLFRCGTAQSSNEPPDVVVVLAKHKMEMITQDRSLKSTPYSQWLEQLRWGRGAAHRR